MIRVLERAGDRLLSAVVPKTTAAAHHCYYTTFCNACTPPFLRPCRYHCCEGSGCRLVRCYSCGPC